MTIAEKIGKIFLSIVIFGIGFGVWVFLSFIGLELGSTYRDLSSGLAGIFILLLCTVIARKLSGSWRDALILAALVVLCVVGLQFLN